MTQLEVAQKFSALNGQKEHGALSVIASLQGKAKLLFEIKPNSFEPMPKVKSALMLISKDDSVVLDDGFKYFLRVAFSQPRKVLVKNLSSLCEKEKILEIFRELDINPTIRGHQLSSLKFYQIYNYKDNNAKKSTKSCFARGFTQE